MKRKTFIAELIQENEVVASATKFAMNSGIRASEGLAREYAREHGVILEGGQPWRHDGEYFRTWRGGGYSLTAWVGEES